MFCSFIMMIMMLLISLILWTRLTTHFQLNKLSLRCAQNNLNFHEVLTWFLSSTTTFNLTPVHFINKELKRFEPPTFPRYVEHKNCICDTIDFLTILLTDPDIAAWSNWVKSVTRTKMLTFHKSRRNSKQRQSFSSFLLEIALVDCHKNSIDNMVNSRI